MLAVQVPDKHISGRSQGAPGGRRGPHWLTEVSQNSSGWQSTSAPQLGPPPTQFHTPWQVQMEAP